MSSTFACGSDATPPSDAPLERVTVRRIEGDVTPGAQVASKPLSTTESVLALSTLGGVAALGTASGMWRVEPDGARLAKVPFFEGGKEADGARVDAIARRTGGGVLAVTARGLYHDAKGFMVPSPAARDLAALGVRRVDVLGDGEVLWLTTDKGAHRVQGGQLSRVALAGVSEPVDAVIGLRDDAAVLVAGGSAWLVDVTARTQRAVDRVGRVDAVDRGEDGTAYVAAETGLWSFGRDGAIAVRTFALPGGPPRAVAAVSAAFGSLTAVVDGQLVVVEPAGARAIGAAPAAKRVAVDAAGDTWVAFEVGAARFATGAPVGFAQHVKPFFERHCIGCHGGAGAGGAPPIAFGDPAVAKEKSALVLRRLRAVDAPPMPPANVEKLAPADYAVVVRWIATGMQP